MSNPSSDSPVVFRLILRVLFDPHILVAGDLHCLHDSRCTRVLTGRCDSPHPCLLVEAWRTDNSLKLWMVAFAPGKCGSAARAH
eukprot:g12850.t1